MSSSTEQPKPHLESGGRETYAQWPMWKLITNQPTHTIPDFMTQVSHWIAAHGEQMEMTHDDLLDFRRHTIKLLAGILYNFGNSRGNKGTFNSKFDFALRDDLTLKQLLSSGYTAYIYTTISSWHQLPAEQRETLVSEVTKDWREWDQRVKVEQPDFQPILHLFGAPPTLNTIEQFNKFVKTSQRTQFACHWEDMYMWFEEVPPRSAHLTLFPAVFHPVLFELQAQVANSNAFLQDKSMLLALANLLSTVFEQLTTQYARPPIYWRGEVITAMPEHMAEYIETSQLSMFDNKLLITDASIVLTIVSDLIEKQPALANLLRNPLQRLLTYLITQCPALIQSQFAVLSLSKLANLVKSRHFGQLAATQLTFIIKSLTELEATTHAPATVEHTRDGWLYLNTHAVVAPIVCLLEHFPLLRAQLTGDQKQTITTQLQYLAPRVQAMYRTILRKTTEVPRDQELEEVYTHPRFRPMLRFFGVVDGWQFTNQFIKAAKKREKEQRAAARLREYLEAIKPITGPLQKISPNGPWRYQPPTQFRAPGLISKSAEVVKALADWRSRYRVPDYAAHLNTAELAPYETAMREYAIAMRNADAPFRPTTPELLVSPDAPETTDWRATLGPFDPLRPIAGTNTGIELENIPPQLMGSNKRQRKKIRAVLEKAGIGFDDHEGLATTIELVLPPAASAEETQNLIQSLAALGLLNVWLDTPDGVQPINGTVLHLTFDNGPEPAGNIENAPRTLRLARHLLEMSGYFTPIGIPEIDQFALLIHDLCLRNQFAVAKQYFDDVTQDPLMLLLTDMSDEKHTNLRQLLAVLFSPANELEHASRRLIKNKRATRETNLWQMRMLHHNHLLTTVAGISLANHVITAYNALEKNGPLSLVGVPSIEHESTFAQLVEHCRNLATSYVPSHHLTCNELLWQYEVTLLQTALMFLMLARAIEQQHAIPLQQSWDPLRRLTVGEYAPFSSVSSIPGAIQGLFDYRSYFTADPTQKDIVERHTAATRLKLLTSAWRSKRTRTDPAHSLGGLRHRFKALLLQRVAELWYPNTLNPRPYYPTFSLTSLTFAGLEFASPGHAIRELANITMPMVETAANAARIVFKTEMLETDPDDAAAIAQLSKRWREYDNWSGHGDVDALTPEEWMRTFRYFFVDTAAE